MLISLLHELDQRILNDPALDSSLFEQLIAAQRELGLVFGDRPTCPFLRPHVISRRQYDEVKRAAQTIAIALERLAGQALSDEKLMNALGVTAKEAGFARIDPGYSRLCVSSRLDAFVSDAGFQFVEYNAETPAGVADQMQLEKVLFKLDHVRDLLEQHPHWRPQPHKRLLRALIDAYREWGGAEVSPTIAIVDWRGVATESEFHILKDYFTSEGHATVIADPRELIYEDGVLKSGKCKIDIIYKRVVIHEFLEKCDESHPLARAYADHRVCMANSFRSKIAHKKAAFAILTDADYASLFSPDELELFRRHVPWTRRVADYKTSFQNDAQNLLDLIRREKDRLVLKPNDDYGGHGVFIGSECSVRDWEQALSLATDRPYVVQERIQMKKIPMPTFSDRARLEELYVDFNPFLFNNEVEGALVRLSSSPLLNVTSGGGQTALLVLEDT